MVIMGLDDATQFDAIVDHHERGSIPPPTMWDPVPAFDPSQAPLGYHRFHVGLPYALGRCKDWDNAARTHGERMIENWSDYAPNVREAVLETFVRSPLDVELPNMRYGDLLIGSLGHGQVGYNRPFAGAGHVMRALRDYTCAVRAVIRAVI